jgi:thioester reductase-like protein/predicted lipid carrier protein YhbT
MSTEETVLVTGVTGSIGSWVARTILDRRRHVLALTRADTEDAGHARTENALKVVGTSVHPGRLAVVCGDLCDDSLAGRLAARSIRLSRIVHCAGVLEFGQEHAELNHRVNGQGTANLLRLAEMLEVPFCHFSTAYVAGKRQGRVFEDEIDLGQEFNNPYESSKCQAERLVQQWSERTGLAAFVFRPSIVVGDSRQGRIVNFDGLYSIMRLLDSVGSVVGTGELRVLGNPGATKNFVPVDYVAETAWHIITAGSPGTYHLTNPHPMPLAKLRDIFAELFTLPGARFVDQKEFRTKQANKLERMYQRGAAVYTPYLAAEPLFDRTRTDVALDGLDVEIPVMNQAFFRKLLRFARQANWGKTAPERVSRSRGRELFVERYFTRFLPEKMHRQLLPNLKRLSATCRIIVEDLPTQTWALRIDRGRLECVSTNGTACQCTFLVQSDVFAAIVSGKLAPQRAFFEKKVDIEGDIETGLKLTTVLAAFFKKWPYDADLCHVG